VNVSIGVLAARLTAARLTAARLTVPRVAEEPTFVVKKKKASKKSHERRVARVHGDELPKHNSMRVSGQYSSDVMNQLKSS